MPEKRIEDYIMQRLTGSAQKNALAFVASLRARQMRFARAKGFWQDQLYWMIQLQEHYVCFILIQGSDTSEPWIVWSDDSGSNCLAGAPVTERIRQTAWKHVDICENCGGCNHPGGGQKTIFGKPFDHVCRTALRFINPDAEALECLKRIVEIRKNEILGNIGP